MQTIAKQLQELLDNVHEAEHTLATIKKFEEEGGQHRLSLSIDHPDHQVRETVAKLAKKHIQKTTLVVWLIQQAERDVKFANNEVLSVALAHVANEQGGA